MWEVQNLHHVPKDSLKVHLEMKTAMQSIITPKLSFWDSRLKERKDNSANVAKRLLLGTVVGSTPLRSLRSSCKEFGVSFRTLKKAINDVKSMEVVRFIMHMSRSRNKTMITDETKTLVINFYNSVLHICPYKNLQFWLKSKDNQLRFLRKHSPNISIFSNKKTKESRWGIPVLKTYDQNTSNWNHKHNIKHAVASSMSILIIYVQNWISFYGLIISP